MNTSLGADEKEENAGAYRKNGTISALRICSLPGFSIDGLKSALRGTIPLNRFPSGRINIGVRKLWLRPCVRSNEGS
jgi:hypothetical protein